MAPPPPIEQLGERADPAVPTEERYRSVVRALAEGIVLQGADGQIIDCNPSAELILGLTRDQMMGRMSVDPRWQSIHEDGSPFPGEEHPAMVTLATGQPCSNVIMGVHRPDGRISWISINAEPLWAPGDPRPQAVVTSFVDVTERYRADAELRRLATAVAKTADAIVVTGPDATIVYVNPAFERITGYTAEEVIGRNPRILGSGHHDAAFYGAMWAALTAGATWRGELHNRRKDGSGFIEEASITPIHDAAGKLVSYVAVKRDITERKRAEEQVRAASTYARGLIEASLDPLVTISPVGTITDVNEATERVTGVPRDRLIGTDFADYFTEPARARAGYEAVLAQGLVRDYPLTIRDASGATTDVLYNATVYHDEAGEVVGVFAAARDITERQRAEEQVLRSRAEMAEAQRIAHVGSWSYDPATDVAVWTDELFRIFGLEPSDRAPTFAEQLRVYTAETGPLLGAAMTRTIETGEPYEVTVDVRRPDGAIRHVLCHGERVLGADGSVTGLRGTAADVTELHEAQTRLDEARRAEMVGRLAGGVAHDFNNLLAAITGYSEFLAAAIPADDPRHGDVDAIRKATSRAADLTHQLLAFGRRQALRPVVLDVDDVVAGLVTMLRSIVGDNVEVVTPHTGPAGHVLVDRTHLEHAIVNLVINARDAMPGGGRVTIETADVSIAPGDARLREPAGPGDYVRLSVTDTGTGMDAETLKHVFEPFFTTKALGHGTGLGLSSVEGSVAQSGGFITVESRVGAGSTFSIHLPRVAERPLARATSVPATTARGGSETILVVEDNDGVRAIATRTLRDLGYTVIEASDPVTALALPRERLASVDLLLTDIVMPGMDGRALAARFAEIAPGVPTLLMSGYTAEQVGSNGLVHARDPLLMKPFSREDLAARVRGLLDRRAPGDA